MNVAFFDRPGMSSAKTNQRKNAKSIFLSLSFLRFDPQKGNSVGEEVRSGSRVVI